MTRVPELFERVLDWHRKMNRAVPRVFRSGLTDAEIDNELSSLPFIFPDSVRDLYKWHDGMDLNDPEDITFFEDLWMFPLARSVTVYRTIRETRSSSDWAEN